MGSVISNLTHFTNPNSDIDYQYLENVKPDLRNVQLNEQNNKIFHLDLSGNFVEESAVKKAKKKLIIRPTDIIALPWEKLQKKLDPSAHRGIKKSDRVIWMKAQIAEEGRIKWIGRIHGGLFAGLQLTNHVTVTLEGWHACKDLKLFNCKKKRGPAVVLLDQIIPYDYFLRIREISTSTPAPGQQQQSDSQNETPVSPSLINFDSIPDSDPMALTKSKVGWSPGDRVFFHKKNEYATVIMVGTDAHKEQYAIIEYENPIGDSKLQPNSNIKFKRGHGRKIPLMKLCAETFIVSPGESSSERNYGVQSAPFSLDDDAEMTDVSMSENSPDLTSKLCKASNLEKISNSIHTMELDFPTDQGASSQSSHDQKKHSLKSKTKVPKLDHHSKPYSTNGRPYNRVVNPSPESDGRYLLDSASVSDLQKGIKSLLNQKDHRQQQQRHGYKNGYDYTNNNQPSSSNPRARGSRAIQYNTNNQSNGIFLGANHNNHTQWGNEEHPDTEEIDSIEGGLKVGQEVLWFTDETSEESCLSFNGTVKKIFKLKCTQGFEAIVDFNVSKKDKLRLKPFETQEGYKVNVSQLFPAQSSDENGIGNELQENGNLSQYSQSSKTSKRGRGKGNKRQKILDENENENFVISPDEPLAPHITENDMDAFGMRKGIVGKSNSCYLDATLFSLFYCTNTFDYMLLTPTEHDEPKIREYKTCLRNIVQILRKRRFVSGSVVMNFRRLISPFNSALLGRFMDAEDLLFILFGDAFKVPHFFEYTTDMSDYIHQLWSEPGQFATVQQLYEHSMEFWGNLKLKNVPSPALILQMPRNDGKLNFERIIPNLQLDLTKVMNGHYFCPCDNPVEIECSSCDQEATGYCINCVGQAGVFHESLSHQFQESKVSQHNSSNLKMNLIAVICVGFNHYTAFVKCGSQLHSPWLFFDSAGPQTCVIRDMASHLEKLGKQPELSISDGDLGGFMTRILTDCHLCIYTV